MEAWLIDKLRKEKEAAKRARVDTHIQLPLPTPPKEPLKPSWNT